MKPLLERKKAHKDKFISSAPILPNERCGPWYTFPWSEKLQSCYFRSLDGHVGTYEFSLKRLNLHLLSILQSKGSCWIVDASRNKIMPDSFSRTLPIWAAVVNRLCLRYRGTESTEDWDSNLYTPSEIVGGEEQKTIESLLDKRVDTVYQSGVILDSSPIRNLAKPLRCVWVTSSNAEMDSVLFQQIEGLSKNFLVIVCVSCGLPSHLRIELGSFYSSGAGDDEEAWSRHLSPPLFWKHREEILNTSTEDEADQVIDAIVHKFQDHSIESERLQSPFQPIGETGIFLGSRRSGRPPECWQLFDAILNVTTTEYPELCSKSKLPFGKFYLQMPVEEGKRDRSELERFLALGLVFMLYHLSNSRTVLVHCAQGKDRSAAVVIAFICLCCDIHDERLSFIRDPQECWDKLSPDMEEPLLLSGFSKSFEEAMKGKAGRDFLLRSLGCEDAVDKSRIRIANHSVGRHRPEVAPTRSTLQKLSRFFMSGNRDNSKD